MYSQQSSHHYVVDTYLYNFQISAVARISDELDYATFTYFRENQFRRVRTPIITTSDCEGAGEMFQVTTLFSSKGGKIGKELIQNHPPQESDTEAAKLIVKEKGESVSQLESLKASKEKIVGFESGLTMAKEGLAIMEKNVGDVSDLSKAKEYLAKLEEVFNVKGGIPHKEEKIDHSHDIEAAKHILKDKGELVSQQNSLKASKEKIISAESEWTTAKVCLAKLEEIACAVSELTNLKECLGKLEERFNVKGGIPHKEGKMDFSHDIEAAKLILKDKGESVSQQQSVKTSKEEIIGAESEWTTAKECLAKLDKIACAVSEVTNLKECLGKLEERFNVKGGTPHKEGKIDFSHDFFGRQAFLTVSGQLQLESYVSELQKVFTFGPTFRAEHSHTSRHLAEFWMVEAEIAFADLEDNMNQAESYVKFLCKWLLDHCLEDMEFMVKNVDKTTIERLKLVSSIPFERISYTETVQLLENVTDKEAYCFYK